MDGQKTHWSEYDQQLRRFWAIAKGDLGLTEDLAHLALGVESLKDFDGPIEEAIARLKGYAAGIPQWNEELHEALTAAPEAGILVWTQFQDGPDGFAWTFSYRECGLPEQLQRLAFANAHAAMETFKRGAVHYGRLPLHDNRYQPGAVPVGPVEPEHEAAPSPTPTPAAQAGTPPPVAAPTAPQQGAEETFPAETLVPNVSGGKTYWKVQGGPFTQWGVTIWPEVLQAAGFDPDALDPMTTHPLGGYVATFVRNEAGKPQKVVRLAPVTAQQ